MNWVNEKFSGARAGLSRGGRRGRASGRARSLRAALAAVALSGVAACGDANQAPAPVAAKVNADEILVSQVDSATKAVGAGATPAPAGEQRKAALDLLVEQQLAAQMALKLRLNRSPEVVRNLDATRREVLARTYVSQLVAQLPEPTDAQVRQYYDQHPLLFAQRRFYLLREIAMPARDAPVTVLRTLAPIASMERLETWLRQQQVEYASSASSRPAEQIPAAVLKEVEALKDGQTTVVENAQGVFVVRLVGSRPAPLGAAAAAPRIRALVAAEQAREAVARHLSELKEKARIEYQSEFIEPPEAALVARSKRAEGLKPAAYDAAHAGR